GLTALGEEQIGALPGEAVEAVGGGGDGVDGGDQARRDGAVVGLAVPVLDAQEHRAAAPLEGQLELAGEAEERRRDEQARQEPLPELVVDAVVAVARVDGGALDLEVRRLGVDAVKVEADLLPVLAL